MADVPLRYRQSEDEATLLEAVLLAQGAEESASTWMTDWLRDGLEAAGNPRELKAAWARVVRYGHSVPTEKLLDVAARQLCRMRQQEQQAVAV
jgi:hypothetical protein